MTKLVQPNVLRAYQSGEQYAINELVLYSGIPAYTNTALAQGVAGIAGNFTNIGGNTFSDSLFRIQDNENATKQIAFEASSVGTGTTKTITMPNANVDLGSISTSSVASGAFVYTDGMGSVTKTLTGSGATFDIDALETNRAHSFTVRNGHTSAVTFSFVSTKIGPSGSGILDESYLTYLGAYNVAGSLSVTLQPNESWEVKYGSVSGNVVYFATKKSFTPLLLTSNLKFRNNLTTALGFTFSGTATVTDKVITIPDANVNLGKIPSSMSYSAGSISLTAADTTYLSAAIGDLPAYATTNSNSITGSLSQILGGTGNNAVGTNTIMIGGKYNSNGSGSNFQTYINAQNLGTQAVKTINARISSSATLSGSETANIKTVSAEYNLVNNHVYNTYATADGVQTLDAFHLPPGVIGERGHGIHELTFMAIANNAGSASATFYDRRMSGKRLFHVNKDYGGTYSISSIQTIGTDISTDTATLSITIDATGLILIAITSVFVGSTEARISLMCNLKSTYAYTRWG